MRCYCGWHDSYVFIVALIIYVQHLQCVVNVQVFACLPLFLLWNLSSVVSISRHSCMMLFCTSYYLKLYHARVKNSKRFRFLGWFLMLDFNDLVKTRVQIISILQYSSIFLVLSANFFDILPYPFVPQILGQHKTRGTVSTSDWHRYHTWYFLWSKWMLH